MNEEGAAIAVFVGLGIIMLLLVLSLPVSGVIFGAEVKLPLIGWIGLAAFAVLAIIAFAQKSH